MKYYMRVIKMDSKTQEKKEVTFPLENIETILHPEEVFSMEFKLNEIPWLRFHIEARDN